MDNRQVVNTIGLSPKELTDISQQQISRDQNMINLLGKALAHKVSSARQLSDADRNTMLNKLTAAQTKELAPVSIEFRGKQFQTTQGNMTQAMRDLRESALIEADLERTEYENTPMQVYIGGRPFDIRRHEFDALSKNLMRQEELSQSAATGARAQQEQDWRMEGIKDLEDSSEVSAQTAAKLNNLGTWMTANKPSEGNDLAAKEYNMKLRDSWNKINVELNKPPEGRAENPLALANSANMIAEELGETVATVVFSDRFDLPGFDLWGFGKGISKGAYKIDELKNPITNQPITIQELRKQAIADNMNLNEALQILYIQKALKED